MDDRKLRLLAEIDEARGDPEFMAAVRRILDRDQRILDGLQVHESEHGQVRRITAVEVLDHYYLRLTFDNGLVGDVDLTDLRGLPEAQVFQPLSDPEFFRLVSVDHGTVIWPGDIDMAPEVLYEQAAAHQV